MTEDLFLEFGGKSYILKVQPLESEINVEELVKIDYSNILGEILTFPVVFNNIGLLRAEINNFSAEAKFDLEVLHAQLSEEHAKRLVSLGEKPTEKKVTDAVLLDNRYIVKKKNYLKIVKQQDYVDSLYWSAKSKDGKLDKLTDRLRPEEFNTEILTERINGVLIKKSKNLIN